MNEIRTTFYEIRSYFVPGGVVLWAIMELLGLTGYEATTRAASAFPVAFKAALFILVAYVIGHALHGIANFTIDKLPFGSYPPSDYFKGKFAEDFSQEAASSLLVAVLSILRAKEPGDGNTNEIIRKAYWVCFQYVMNEQNLETENFLGLTGFYRGITVAMMSISVMYLYVFFEIKMSADIWWIGVMATALTLLFLMRVKKFGYYLARTVYSNFLYIYNEKKQTEN